MGLMSLGFGINWLFRAALGSIVLWISGLDKVVKIMIYDSIYEVQLHHQLV